MERGSALLAMTGTKAFRLIRSGSALPLSSRHAAKESDYQQNVANGFRQHEHAEHGDEPRRDGDRHVKKKREQYIEPDGTEKPVHPPPAKIHKAHRGAENDEGDVAYHAPGDAAAVLEPAVLREKAERAARRRESEHAERDGAVFLRPEAINADVIHQHVENGHRYGGNELSYAESGGEVRGNEVIEHARYEMKRVPAAEYERGKPHEPFGLASRLCEYHAAADDGEEQIQYIEGRFSVLQWKFSSLNVSFRRGGFSGGAPSRVSLYIITDRASTASGGYSGFSRGRKKGIILKKRRHVRREDEILRKPARGNEGAMKEDRQRDIINSSIIHDLSEGILTLGLDGRIGMVNPAAEAILGMPKEEMQGRSFSAVFFGREENDLFNQTVLDAVYDPDSKHESVVPYYDGKGLRRLRVTTSFLHAGGERIGIIAVIGDLTELAEMEIRHMEQVDALIDSMVKTLSVAIDERSHYTANHTRNMVSMGERFLDWLEETGNPWKFDAQRRRALLMSVWLHDIGKIAIPLEIMDKASRLGPALGAVEERFSRVALLDRIALLEGRMTDEEHGRLSRERARILEFIRKINTAGFVTDGDIEEIRRLSALTYTEADGRELPLLTAGEVEELSVRKGTLTAPEREIMQSHAALTRRILEQVSFPPEYKDVPLWASSHHKLLNGGGYPERREGEALPEEVQLITILDVFEALTARDRPYKPPIPPRKAWDILESMAREGSISGALLKLFRESRAWQAILPEESE